MISVVFITKNESENIARSLAAIAELKAEIILVDHGSTDQTVEIARSFGARVFSKSWTGYSDGKNFGNSQAAHPWILSLDADEVLSKDLIKSIKNLDLSDTELVYALDRANYFGETWVKHCGWYPDWKVRLFHKDVGYWEGDYVHEELMFNKKVNVVKLNGLLHHYSYKDDADHLQRMEKYVQLGAEKLVASGKRPSKLKQWISPYARFFRTYVLKLGFLDGSIGWKISRRNILMVKRKYEVYNELIKNRRP